MKHGFNSGMLMDEANKVARPPLQQYTLALMTPAQTESQLRIGQFQEPGKAIQLAELIAAEMSLEPGRLGWSIEVRDPQGAKLYTAPCAAL
jgi:hypothetical protein